MAKSSFWSARSIPWLLFLVVALSHSFSQVKNLADSNWSLPTAMSILVERNTDLSEYSDMVSADDYRLEWVDGRPYNIFPVGASIFALPFVAVIDGVLRLTRGESYAQELRRGHGDVERAIASILVALAAVCLYQTVLRWPASRGVALVTALLFAFATPAWSTASRALWQHAPSLLMLACAAGLWLRGQDDPRKIPWIALPLALAFLCRPTNAVPIAVFTTLVALRYPRRIPAYIAVAAVVAVPWFIHNLVTYDLWLPPYYQPGRIAGSVHFGEALLGNLVSPARGLLVYSPFLAFSVWGVVMAWREPRHRDLALAVSLIFLGHWLAIASFPHWWAGHCYGPRFFADLTPLLALMLVPVFTRVSRDLARKPSVVSLIFVALAGWSLYTNALGATVETALRWNGLPVDVDLAPQRLWDWSDPAFLRWHDPADPRQGTPPGEIAYRRA
jgi:hypothetical protein